MARTEDEIVLIFSIMMVFLMFPIFRVHLKYSFNILEFSLRLELNIFQFMWFNLGCDNLYNGCRAPLHEECHKHLGHKRNHGVTLGTCGANGERAQVILVWLRASGVGNTSHPLRLRVPRVWP
jgi:hypothetical protein